MKVDGHVIPVLLLVNIDIHAGTRAVFLYDARTLFLYYHRRRRGRGHVGGSGCYWRRRLLTSGDPE
jgi:hypothetical protein